jgi:hypothetical protein
MTEIESTIRNLKSEDLDSVVHDAASRLATNANNDGKKAQLEFLTVVCGMDEESIVEELPFGQHLFT